MFYFWTISPFLKGERDLRCSVRFQKYQPRKKNGDAGKDAVRVGRVSVRGGDGQTFSLEGPQPSIFESRPTRELKCLLL
jgi:hypothetical protein